MNPDLLTDKAANMARMRELCVLWAARAMAHRACNGNPESPYVVMRDAFNAMIGRTDFSSVEFFKYAPAFGINPYAVERIDIDALDADNAYYPTSKDNRAINFGNIATTSQGDKVLFAPGVAYTTNPENELTKNPNGRVIVKVTDIILANDKVFIYF